MLIDEIDNGLHFHLYEKALRIILYSAKLNNIQLFITTHSKESLQLLKDVLEEDDSKTYRDEVKCFTISKLNDDTLKAYPYNFESFEYAIENDIEIRGQI